MAGAAIEEHPRGCGRAQRLDSARDDRGAGCWSPSCADPTTTFSENFDGVTPPALPAGWTATNVQGHAPLWTTSNTGMPTPPFDTPPNAAFVDNPQVVSDKRLDSPSIPIATGSAQLTFRNNYYTETTFDGGVLEISIGGGAFQDIRAAGGSLVVGTYSGTLQTGLDNPLSGRLAWTGNSNNGFITSVVTLPPSAAGQNVVLRWRLGSDNGHRGAWLAHRHDQDQRVPRLAAPAPAAASAATTPASSAASSTPPPPPPPPPKCPVGSTQVTIGDFSFDPDTLDVPVGTTVCWGNAGLRAAHRHVGRRR